MNGFVKRNMVGLGGAFENSMQNAPAVLALPILNVGLGISPIIIGIALAIPRLWEILIDPWIGVLSDRTRSRWGRRTPFLVIGAFSSCALYAILWWVPPTWSSTTQNAWVIGLMLLLYTAFSVYAVAYSALAIEWAADQERVRLMASRTAWSNISAIVIGWLYFACQFPVFANVVEGARFVGIVFAALLLVASLMPAIAARGSNQAAVEKKGGTSHGMLLTVLKIPSLRRLLIALFCFVCGFTLVAQLGFYIVLFYVFSGDQHATGVLSGVISTIGSVSAVISAPYIAKISGRMGKRNAFTLFLTVGGLGCAATWWTMNPAIPYLVIISVVAQAIGLAAFWTIMPALLGEVSDTLEKDRGLAWQGVLSAVYGIVVKSAISISLLLTGVLLFLCGFEAHMKLEEMPPALTNMRIFYAVVPCAGILMSIAAIRRFHSEVPMQKFPAALPLKTEVDL